MHITIKRIVEIEKLLDAEAPIETANKIKNILSGILADFEDALAGKKVMEHTIDELKKENEKLDFKNSVFQSMLNSAIISLGGELPY